MTVTAQKAYDARLANIRSKLSTLQTLAGRNFNHPVLAGWPHVGDLAQVDQLLGQILSHFPDEEKTLELCSPAVTMVRYRNRDYRVVEDSDADRYRLASKTMDGSPFYALKSECVTVGHLCKTTDRAGRDIETFVPMKAEP